MSLSLVKMQEQDAAQWDAFVECHPEGRFSQLWGYRQALEDTYGYRCVYLRIEVDGKRIGVFPSVVATGGLPRLVSQPFNEYGGPLVNGSLTPEADVDLGRLLLSAARDEGCKCVEIRGGVGWQSAEDVTGVLKKPLYRYGELPLGDPEELWRKCLTHEARKGVNQARKAGLEFIIRCGPEAVQMPFYNLYLASMKRLGVPPHPLRFFECLSQALGGRLVSAWVFSHNQPVAVLLGGVSGQRLQAWITASEVNQWSARPNDLAHWELIRWAALQKLRVFDFGSARYAGQIQFKKKWGVDFREYSCYLIGQTGARSNFGVPSVDSSGRWMITMSQVWRTCVPLWATSWLGRPIRKYLTK